MFNLEQARRPVALLRELRKLRRQTDLYTLTDISVSFSPTWMQGRSQRIGLSNQEFIMTELIREYLVFNQCTNTVSVLTPGTLLCHLFVYHRHLVSICEGLGLILGGGWYRMHGWECLIQRNFKVCGAPAMGLIRVTEQCGFEATCVAETGLPQIPLDRSFLAARLGIQEDSTTQQKWALSAFDI